MKNYLYVINSKGEKEIFSSKKVYRSARRVGASQFFAKKIAKIIEKEAFPGIKTSEIFRKVKRLLAKETPRFALKFSLKTAMRRLGPTGFLFEKYIGEIFSKRGFKVKLNQNIPGLCCRYEIDFLARKNNLLYIGECKYRNLPGGLVHSDTALANYARFLDIKKGTFFDKKANKNLKIKSLLVTNAKLTNKAVKYSKCVGVELLGWNYPKNKGLERLIDTQRLYPITIFPSLKHYFADIFVEKRIILAQDLLKIDVKRFARETKIPVKYLEALAKEAKILLGQ